MIAQFPSEVAVRIQALIEASKLTLLGPTGVVAYGDQRRIPVTPYVCVEPGTVNRVLDGVATNAGRTRNDLECLLLIYTSLLDTNEETKLASDQRGELIASFLDDNPTLELDGDGGIVIHGYVTTINPGYSFKNGWYNAVRLTWNGKSKTILGA